MLVVMCMTSMITTMLSCSTKTTLCEVKMKCFHGTSLDNAIRIINGSTDKPSGLWQESDRDNMFYVFPADKLSRHLCCSNDVDRMVKDVAWHGQTALLFEPNDRTMYVVLEMEIDEYLLADDHSCESMDDVASCISIGDIKHIEFKAVHVGALNLWDRPMLLAGIIDRDNVNTYCMDHRLVQLADNIPGSLWRDIEVNTTRHEFPAFKKAFM